MSERLRSRAAFVLVGTLALGGCVGSLLGGGKPDALYRFGATSLVTTPQQLTAPRRILMLHLPQFTPAVGGDRILTSQSGEASYIKDMRWVSAAPMLYAAAIEATVANRAPDMALANRANDGRADAVLTISVERFEATYPAAENVAPNIHVDGHAVLFDPVSKAIVGRYRFSSTREATENSRMAIAAAFDVATSQTVVQIVDWTNVTMPLPKPRKPQ